MMRKPLSGAISGLILGLAVAVLLQQHGIWPLDELTVALLPGVLGLIGVLVTSVGRTGGGAALMVAIVITGAATAYGATGLGTINEVGQLDGGCVVQSQSSAPDSTTVTDSSKQSPYEIDPDGTLAWQATSPVAFMDYDWKLWVEIGGVQVPIDSGHEQNDGGSTGNFGDVSNVRTHGEARGIPVSQMLGVYKVGGDAALPSGCEGFGFVKLLSDPFETLASKVAAGLAILALIMLIRAALVGRGGAAAAAGGSDSSGGGGEAADSGPDVAGAVVPED